MTRRPDVPQMEQRAMSLEASAFYVGASEGSFEKMVAEGIMPPALNLGIRRRLWDRHALDASLDRLSGVGPSTSGDEQHALEALDAHERAIR